MTLYLVIFSSILVIILSYYVIFKKNKFSIFPWIISLFFLLLSSQLEYISTLGISAPLLKINTTLNHIEKEQEISDRKLQILIDMIKISDTKPMLWAVEEGREPLSKEIDSLQKLLVK